MSGVGLNAAPIERDGRVRQPLRVLGTILVWIALAVVGIPGLFCALIADIGVVDGIARGVLGWDLQSPLVVTALPHAVWLAAWFGTRSSFDRRVCRALFAMWLSLPLFLVAALMWVLASVI
jgi:hypothetical protein